MVIRTIFSRPKKKKNSKKFIPFSFPARLHDSTTPHVPRETHYTSSKMLLLHLLHLLCFIQITTTTTTTTTTKSNVQSSLRSLALSHLQNGDSTSALAALTHPSVNLSIFEHDPQLNLLLSVASVDQHKYHVAIRSASRALKLSNSSPGIASAARYVFK